MESVRRSAGMPILTVMIFVRAYQRFPPLSPFFFLGVSSVVCWLICDWLYLWQHYFVIFVGQWRRWQYRKVLHQQLRWVQMSARQYRYIIHQEHQLPSVQMSARPGRERSHWKTERMVEWGKKLEICSFGNKKTMKAIVRRKRFDVKRALTHVHVLPKESRS